MPSLSEKREAARGTTERNRGIVSAYIDGVLFEEISRRFSISEARIHDIIAMYKLRAIRYNREKERPYVREDHRTL